MVTFGMVRTTEDDFVNVNADGKPSSESSWSELDGFARIAAPRATTAKPVVLVYRERR